MRCKRGWSVQPVEKGNEDGGYRKFGGRPFVPLPVRDVPANMQVTAKQIRCLMEQTLME